MMLLFEEGGEGRNHQFFWTPKWIVCEVQNKENLLWGRHVEFSCSFWDIFLVGTHSLRFDKDQWMLRKNNFNFPYYSYLFVMISVILTSAVKNNWPIWIDFHQVINYLKWDSHHELYGDSSWSWLVFIYVVIRVNKTAIKATPVVRFLASSTYDNHLYTATTSRDNQRIHRRIFSKCKWTTC